MHTHIHYRPDLANLQILNFKHINRPIECKVAFSVFIIKAYTFPKGGRSFFMYIYQHIYNSIYLSCWLWNFGWFWKYVLNIFYYLDKSTFSANISRYKALMNWSVSCNTWSNLHWSKFSSTDHKSGHVLVYCDFNLQRWWAATGLALISNLKTIYFTEVYFTAKIMGESF